MTLFERAIANWREGSNGSPEWERAILELEALHSVGCVEAVACGPDAYGFKLTPKGELHAQLRLKTAGHA